MKIFLITWLKYKRVKAFNYDILFTPDCKALETLLINVPLFTGLEGDEKERKKTTFVGCSCVSTLIDCANGSIVIILDLILHFG